MSDRAVSTVLDVSVCLLLVGAAALLLVTAPVAGPADPAAGRAEELATTLAGSTATVTYATGDGATTDDERTARGTYAGLLADAARTDAMAPAGSFRTAVRNATRPLLAGDGWRAQVVVVWRPYDGAEPGRVVVGRSPPRDADVHAATIVVPSGIAPAGRSPRTAAEEDGFRGVAAVLADALHPGANATTRRRHVGRTTTSLRRAFETPAAAAQALRLDEARLTVRTWSP